MNSSTRRRKIASSIKTETSNVVTHGKCELDSHADTTVAGKNCIVLTYTGK